MNDIFLSIVIANYNYGRFLEVAIKSILDQEMSDKVEIIICDAASTDNSVEIIKKYEGEIAWWCSEKDGGQSAAFNKGFSHARGRFLTWLNADDILMPGTIKALYKLVGKKPTVHWVTGNLITFEQHSGRIIEATWGPHWVPKWVQGNGSPIAVFGPTTFWSREAYLTVGKIDESLHYTMDTDYWMRLLNAGYRFKRLNHICWGFRLHEISKTATYSTHELPAHVRRKIDAEKSYIYEKNHFTVTKFGSLINKGFRIIDGSRFIDVWRRLFVQGRKFPRAY